MSGERTTQLVPCACSPGTRCVHREFRPAPERRPGFVEYVVRFGEDDGAFRVHRQRGRWVLGNRSEREESEGLVHGGFPGEGEGRPAFRWSSCAAAGFPTLGEAVAALLAAVPEEERGG